MDIKTNIRTLVLTCFLGLLPIAAFSDKGTNPGGGSLGIEAMSMQISPVSFSVTQGVRVNASFASNMGIVNININDSNGFAVYTESVDTSNTSKLQIDTFGYPSGTYTVSCSDSNGRMLKKTTFTVD